MWEWLITYSVWIFILSALVLLLMFGIGGRVRGVIDGMTPERWRERLHRSTHIIGWIIGGITTGIVALALAAIVISEEGVAATITSESIEKWFLVHGVRILGILALGIGLWFALKKFLPPLIRHSMATPRRGESKLGMKKRADTLTGVFMGLGKVLIVLLIAFMILSELNIPVTPVLAGFGIAGIAVGFGAQYLIRDLIAGVFILMENQYRVGDVARVADIPGLVEDITLRKTVLRDLDGIVHHVPNGEIQVASNFSRHFSRVNLDISVAYGTDLEHAIRVINRVGQELANDENWRERILTPPQVLRVNKLGDSGIDIKVLGDVKPLEQWVVTGQLRLLLKKAFDEEGIEIPWPHIKFYFGEPQAASAIVHASCSHGNPPSSKFCAQCGAKLDVSQI
jgi:small conductance mechanosensitive channel